MRHQRSIYYPSDYSVAKSIKETFPELHLRTDEIEERLEDLDVLFYKYKEVKASFLIRLTVILIPFVIIGFTLFSPIKYIYSGRWGYNLKFMTNWFNKLGF